MIDLVALDDLYEPAETGTLFLNFAGEVLLEVADTEVDFWSLDVEFGFTVYALTALDELYQSVSDSPDLLLYPAALSAADTVVSPVSSAVYLTLGHLPKGLQMIDNGDGTAHIYGTPALNTEGRYEIPVVVVSVGNPDVTHTLILEIK